MLQRPDRKSFDLHKSLSTMPKIRSYLDPPKVISIALLLVSFVPVALAVVVTVRHWVPLPYWDEWYTPGLLLTAYARGTLSFSHFFLQHNESRKFFPRLLYITLAKLHGWDVRDAMAVTLFEVAAICGLLFWLFLRTKGATTIMALVAFTVTTFLCFAPVQYDNFLWGLVFELFVPGLAVILVAVVNLSRLRFGVKTVINIVLALVATYTFANGMLLWVLGVPLPAVQERASKRARLVWYSLFALTGAAAIASYFVGYKRPEAHPPLHFGILQLLHYLILWVGGYYNSTRVSPFLVGVIVSTLCIVATARAIMRLNHGAPWRHFYPWFLISAYGLSSGVITAMGRVGFGVEQALSTRYAVFSLFIYLGLVGTTFALYCYDQDRIGAYRRRWIVIVSIAVIALSAPAWSFCLHDAKRLANRTGERNARLLCALEWMDVFPTNPDLKLIFPYPDVLRIRAHAIAGAGLLRCHLLSPRLLDQLKETTHSSTDLSHGRLETAIVQGNALITSGWIWPSKKNRNCVLIAFKKTTGQVALMSVIAPTIARPDIERRYQHERMKPVGFRDQTRVSMLGEGRIEAWAVDTTAEVAWPLGASVSATDQ